jgi:hypothetical protein
MHSCASVGAAAVAAADTADVALSAAACLQDAAAAAIASGKRDTVWFSGVQQGLTALQCIASCVSCAACILVSA